MSAKSCQHCGKPFGATFTLTLDEALRAGAIARGMDIDEEEVQESEKMATSFRNKALADGDQTLVRLIRQLPDETFARLKKYISDSDKG